MTIRPMSNDEVERPIPSQKPVTLWGSDAIADTLREIGLEYVSFNPGASCRGLQDSVVNYLENVDPKLLLCLHEESAVAIAHGYAKVTGRPMGTLLHSNVGLMHATMAIFNAWCDRVPIVLLGATGPWDAAARRPWIDWLHTCADQGALVRDYTKWDNQPASVEAAREALYRARQIACTAPRGPTYVNLDSAIQEQQATPAHMARSGMRYAPPQTVIPTESVIRETATILQGAKRLVILAGRVSRSETAWQERIALAERLNARVVSDTKAGAAFPNEHPLYVGPPGVFLEAPVKAAIKSADVILSLDWIDLAGAIKQSCGDEACTARIVNITPDAHSHRGWSMDYMALAPAEQYLMCEPDPVVTELLKVIAPNNDTAFAMQPLKQDVTTTHNGIAIGDVGLALAHALKDKDFCITRLPLGWHDDVIPFRHPLAYLGLEGGGGVGAGPGLAVGAALALKGSNRIPVAFMGDGDFLMGITALWTGAHYRIPGLIVVSNNSSYFIDEGHQERVAARRDRPVENKWIGQRMEDPQIDILGLAKAQGVDGIRIRSRETLNALMAQAVERVQGGEFIVVDVAVGDGSATHLN